MPELYPTDYPARLDQLKRKLGRIIRQAEKDRHGRFGEARSILNARLETWQEADALVARTFAPPKTSRKR